MHPVVYVFLGVLMAAALGLLFWMQRRMARPDTSRAAALMDRYRELTPETLAAVPDDEAVKAVVCNILAKAEEHRIDPYRLLPGLSEERRAVYTVWLFLKELEHDPAALRQKDQRTLSALAVDALRALEVNPVADALDRFLETGDTAEIDTLCTLTAEADVPSLLVAWIRSAPEAFCDAPRD